MTVIRYTDPKRYLFASYLLKFTSSLDNQITRNSAHYEINVENEFLAQLLERIKDGRKAVVVPNLKDSRLLIAAPDRRQLEQAYQRIRHFLVPTYATFEQELRPHKFDDKNPFQRLGAELYPSGYYVLRSRKEFESQVLASLRLWMELEERYPRLEQHDESLTYGRLYEQFKMALATAQWSDAEQARRTMLLRNLTSAENLLFLEIEQFALQHRWSEIWQRRDRSQLVQARVPRPVRGALLTAFHQTTLLPLEQQDRWQDALQTFREHAPALGVLLTGRLGLTEGSVVQVFAYQAVLEQDRETLLELMNVNARPEVQRCIQNLLALLDAQEPSVPTEQAVDRDEPLKLARKALDYGNYDAARRYSEEVEEYDDRTVLLMQIAYHTVDNSLAEEALSAYSKISDEEQQQLLQRFPFINHIRGALQKLTIATEMQKLEDVEQQPILIQDWLTWFDHIEHHSSSGSEMSEAILRLAEICDERFWTAQHIEQFAERLLSIIDNAQLIKKDLVRDALVRVAQFFLSDQEFPRTDVSFYRDLYEALYMAFLKTSKELQYTGWFLLRLAEARLRYASDKCTPIFRDLEEWCGAPMAILEPWALETCEMLLDYGLEPAVLTNWYQLWLTELMRVRPRHQITNLNGWLELGRCIPSEHSLLEALREQLSERQKVTDDPIKLLPEGYKIGIYSLLEPSARRASEQLLARNASLKISICTDKVLTKDAEAIAQGSDMIVMVITAMKHAVTNGIMPLIDPGKIVRPQSSGATSLVRAVEEYAGKYFL
jgi:hypothetical protein